MDINGQIHQLTDEKLVSAYQEAKKQGDFILADGMKKELSCRFGENIGDWINQKFAGLPNDIDHDNYTAILDNLERQTSRLISKKWEDDTIFCGFNGQTAFFEDYLQNFIKSTECDEQIILEYRRAKFQKDDHTVKTAIINKLWTIYDQQKTYEAIQGFLSEINALYLSESVQEIVWEKMIEKWSNGSILDGFDLTRPFRPYWQQIVKNVVLDVLKDLSELRRVLDDPPANRLLVKLSEDELEELREQVDKACQSYALYRLAIIKLKIGIYNLTEEEIKALVAWIYPDATEAEKLEKFNEIKERLEQKACDVRFRESQQEIQEFKKVIKAQAKLEHKKTELEKFEEKLKSASGTEREKFLRKIEEAEQQVEKGQKSYDDARYELRNLETGMTSLEIVFILVGEKADQKTKKVLKDRIDKLWSRR